jgi:hypothetical protein
MLWPTVLPAPLSGAEVLVGSGVGLELLLDQTFQPTSPCIVSMAYRDADVAGLDPHRLIIARFDPDHSIWTPLSSTSDPANHRVTASTNHFSLFQIMQAAQATDVSNVKIFPNPLRPSQGNTFVTFSNLPASTRLRIYTLAGTQIADITTNASGIATWDGRNETGGSVASGVYFVLAEGGGQARTFKVAVQR